uniref:Uncharacterized protein n=1 Tax=Myripristis murdjan TaxID=586833 RepID=A0A668A1U4_9TELE
MILTKQLEEAEDGLHNDDYKTHLPFILVLVTGVDRHRGFDLQLGELHTIIEDPEELLRFFVLCQTAIE